ncbi:MAG: DUF3343 domain-containing protein [Ruminococcaceae bacterium]|nr:DUF3343 domain-containing protein [Oscillospiraceae bacterium]
MKTEFITFRSVTPAQRGQRVLQRAGVDTLIQRTPRWMAEKGCGYCLRLRPEELIRAVDLLRRENVPFSKVYATVGGSLEERQV